VVTTGHYGGSGTGCPCSACRPEDDPTPRIDRIREALGAVAAREPAVFWLYMDGGGRWCVRREGASGEHRFDNREACLDYLELEAVRCASFRLFVQGSDGRIADRSFNWVQVV
jgi:hypothetical protein